MSVTEVAERTRPGRHRSAEADAAILDATLDLLRERGYGALTMAAVIERAGVSSATLYRRWTTKSELVAAAVASLTPEAFDTDTGSIEGDLAAFLRHVVRAVAAKGNITSYLQPTDKTDPELGEALRARLLTPRVRALQAILDRAIERGEITAPPSAEMYLPMLVGPLHYRVVLNEPLSPAFVKTVLRYALDGLKSV